jgi:glycosyltransferase involved in cell wall biosynthesis
MPDLTPSVSAVIPTYNHARFLGDAIESTLRQRVAATEVIVVDDGSADDPAAVVQRFPTVRLIRQANAGLAGA